MFDFGDMWSSSFAVVVFKPHLRLIPSNHAGAKCQFSQPECHALVPSMHPSFQNTTLISAVGWSAREVRDVWRSRMADPE